MTEQKEEQCIMSLLPACTEVVSLLGKENRLVARSHACDFPSSVRSLPVATQPRVDASKPGTSIHNSMEDLLSQGMSIFDIDVDLIRRLKPDLILTQSQCEVCAVSEVSLRKAMESELGYVPHVISFSPATLEEVWSGIMDMGAAMESAEEAVRLSAKCRERVQQIARQVDVSLGIRPPSVACVEWLDPVMAAGNWVPEMVEFAGGLNLFGEAGKHSPWLNWEAVCEHDPEFMVFMPCGFDLDRCRKEWRVLRDRPGWSNLRAVREGNVVLTDGSAYFNRPGPRLVDSLEILAEVIHPDIFSFGYEGVAWVKAETD